MSYAKTVDAINGKHGADYVEELKPPPDVNDSKHVGGNALLVSRDGEVRKLPVPSSNPNDPLNFRGWEKTGIVICCCWFSIMGLSMAGGLGAILSVFFGLYMPQGYTSDQIVFLITMPSLCIGLGTSTDCGVSSTFLITILQATTSSFHSRSHLDADQSS